MEQIIPLFVIASLEHDCYNGVKSSYLDGDPTLVNYELLVLGSLLSSKGTRQQALGLPSPTPSVTSNQVSDAPYLSPTKV